MSEALTFNENQEKELVLGLFNRGIIKFGEFTLKSGRKSPIYYNQRPLLSVSKELATRGSREPVMTVIDQKRVAYLAIEGYAAQVNDSWDSWSHDHLYGIPQAATAIGARVAQAARDSYLWGRVGKKDYGKHEGIEGDFVEGEKVLQLDDVVTNADSKIESAANLEEAGLQTVGFVVMFDRQEGGSEALSKAGYQMSAVTNLTNTVQFLAESYRIGSEEIEALNVYHEGLRSEGVESTFQYPG